MNRARLWRLMLLGLGPLLLVAAELRPDNLVIPQLLALWIVMAALWLSYRGWRWFSYFIAARLTVSHLMAALIPIPIFLTLVAAATYFLAGQYLAVRSADHDRQLVERLDRVAASALDAWQRSDETAARHSLEAAGARLQGLPALDWIFIGTDDNAASARLQGLEALWADPRPVDGVFRASLDEVHAYLGVARFLDGRRGVIVASIASEPAVDPCEAVFFNCLLLEYTRGDASLQVGPSGRTELIIEDGAAERRFSPEGFPIFWIRRSGPMIDLETGESLEIEGLHVLSSSIAGIHQDFMATDYELSNKVLSIFGGLAVVLATAWFAVLLLVALLVRRVTRAVADLSNGAKQVAAGRFDHRIPVRRKDQLGELATVFNGMTESVRGMMAELEEKQRLAAELQLATEIQRSLLPDSSLSLEGLEIASHFSPAAEVGGDYYDYFKLSGDRMLVMIGDVAGHGLSTGLVMAMVKSAAAALVAEGHRGIALLERLNAVLLSQRERHMVTLQAIEIDLGVGSLMIANAGHTPPLLVSPGGSVEEILLCALPAGVRWPHPPSERVAPFPPGSRLVLASDGLVEGGGVESEPFGWERLFAEIEAGRALSAQTQIERLLTRLESHLDGHPLADDLTILIIDHQTRPEGPSSDG